MPDETRKEGRASHGFATLAGVLIAFLLLAAGYVLYQAMHVLFPQNVYETALPAVISDTVDADGVLLFDESYVAGSGNLGYLAADGARFRRYCGGRNLQQCIAGHAAPAADPAE